MEIKIFDNIVDVRKVIYKVIIMYYIIVKSVIYDKFIYQTKKSYL